MQTFAHKLKHNAIQMLYKTNKHKKNNLFKYTTQEHTGYVTSNYTFFQLLQGVLCRGTQPPC